MQKSRSSRLQFTGRMPFLSPSQQCQSTEGKNITFHGLAYPSLPGVLPALSLTTNSSCLPWGRFAMPLISPLVPKVKVKVHTLDIAPLRSESPPQKRSGMARVLKGFQSFTCTPTRSSAIGMSHTCLCLPSYNWYSFTDPRGMEG